MIRSRPALAAVALACLLAGAAGSGGAARAQDAATMARDAAARLEAAAADLASAEDARNRVKALTATLRAFETGLTAMRDSLRAVIVRETELAARLAAREDEVAQLTGVLMTLSGDDVPVAMLHPAGPLGTARSGMILADVAPALDARAAELRALLTDVRSTRALRAASAETLQKGLDGAQRARAALSQAVADRTALPRRFTEDPVQTALLIASTETLTAFADGLSNIAVDEAAGSLPDISDRKGTLPWPAEGRVLRHAGETDAAGIARPGIILATRPGAVVTTPVAATIRYRGPLLDYGNVMILEPQAGILFVLAGLEVVYGAGGEVLPAGSPVGLMGGASRPDDGLLARADPDAGGTRSETLYIEVRQDNQPQDPEMWFQMTKEG